MALSVSDRLANLAGRLLLNGLLGTTVMRSRGEEHFLRFREQGQPVIFVVWHGRLLPLAYHHRHQELVTLVSQSRDGEHITRIVERWGYATVRGSSSRGGSAALRGLIRHARQGRSLVFTPDGPRGPRQEMKLGPLIAAQLTGLPLVPASAGTGRAWWVGSWDRFLVPKPFARVQLAYGEPHHIPPGADEAELLRRANSLKAALDRLQAGVDGANHVAPH